VTFLDWLLRTSWQVAVLVLLILALQRVFGSRIAPRWRYALWWIVVLRLVLPPISIAGIDLEKSLVPEQAQTAEVEIAAPAPEAAESVTMAPPTRPEPVTTVPPAPLEAAPVVEVETSPQAPTTSPGLPYGTILLGIWIAGVVGLLAFTLIREALAASKLSFAPPVRFPEVAPLVDRCRAEAGIRRRVAVAITERTRVPALIGLFRPRLLLPPSILLSLSQEELRYVIHHELEHVRHHDLIVNWLLQILLCLNWLNPFVWIAFARLRSDREVVRDLGVLSRTPGATGKAYGRTILRIVELAVPVRAPTARVAILETKKDVKRRITMLARYEKKTARGAFAGVALTLCLALFATVAASQESEEAQPARGDDRPGVLVVGFSVSGELLAKESGAAVGLEILTEALLADHYQLASAAQLEEACEAVGCRVADLARDAELRLAVAKDLGGVPCISGWASSFGKRIVLIAEVIDPAKGLPGKVHRASCDGLEGIPAALEELLGGAGLLEAVKTPAVREEAVEPLPDLPEDDLLETYPNDSYRKYLKMRESADPRDRVLMEKLLAESMAHAHRLNEDRDYRDEWVIRTNVRVDPVYKDYDFDVVRRGPYLMFVQKCGDPSVLGHASRLGDVLQNYYQGFLELFGEPLDLVPLADRKRSSERILKILVVTKRESLKHRRLPPGVTGFYSPSDQWVILFIDEGQEVDEGRLTSLRMKLVHEATHQLVHYLTKFQLEKERGEEVLFPDPDVRPKRIWLSDGLADLMAGAMWADGSLDLRRPNTPRMKEWEQARRQKLNDWSLFEILTIDSPAAMRRRASQKALAQAPRLSSLFYAQATSYCHFMWNHEDPKYREHILSEFRRELSAAPRRELVSTIDDLEKEWRASLPK